MNKNEKLLGRAIAFCFWLLIIDFTVENPMPVLAATLISSAGTIIAIYLPSIIFKYGKE